MKISKLTPYLNAGAGRKDAGKVDGSPFGALSARDTQSASADGEPAVINKINHDVYYAVDEFLYLKGEDRIESYENLSPDDRDRFLGIVSKLMDKGYVKKEKLEQEDPEELERIEKDIENWRIHSINDYGEQAKAV